MSTLLPTLAAHLSKTEVVFTADFLRELLDGQTFIIGGQTIRAVSDERTMLRQCLWATRPTKLWDER
jgi:hypothetical protein